MVQIAVLGHGVVGSGVVEVLEKNASGIQRRAGKEIQIKHILDKREFPDLAYASKFTKDFGVITSDEEVRVVAEVMGGVHPAYEFVKSALQAGKHVVSSNKELVAAKGAELLRIAAEHNVNFLFEASVGGGIPIIRPLHQCLAANEIDEIAGILNGTTNFILTKMIREGMPFHDALALAQKLGYAEANPAADVEGHDACRKICILASLAFGVHIYPEDVRTQGITAIAQEDVKYAESADCVIKLIGQAHSTGDGSVYAMVSPALIHKESQLAGVDDVFNGILVRGDATGDVVFYGKGAGKLPTASAVVGDIIDCVKAEGTIRSLTWAESTGGNVSDYKAHTVRFYIRCWGNQSKAAAAVSRIFGDVQQLSRKKQPSDELAFLTQELPEGDIEKGILQLEEQNLRILGAIRLLDY